MNKAIEKRDTWHQILKTARQQQGFTQEMLADILRIDPRTLRDWESGRHAPQYSVRRKLYEVLHLTPEELGPLNKNIEKPLHSVESLHIEAKGEQDYSRKEGEHEHSDSLVANKNTTTVISQPENDSASELSIKEKISAESVRALINLLATSGIRPEDARLKGYESAFQLATEIVHSYSEVQSLPTNTILQSAMRIYRMSIDMNDQEKE